MRSEILTITTKLSFALAIVVTSSTAHADVIADFKADFKAKEPGEGWDYKWNPTGAEIGKSESYVKLVDPGGNWRVSADATNPPGKAGPKDAKWLQVTMKGEIAPGEPKTEAGDGNDHYVIAAYTIQSGEEGKGSIKAGSIKRKVDFGSGELRIYVNDKLINSAKIFKDQAKAFSLELGDLKEGDTVYVAFGPNGTSAAGALLQFQIDTTK